MITICTGLPGAGKSYITAQTAVDMLYRNKAWYAKQLKMYNKGQLLERPVRRKVVSNLKLNSEIEEFFGYDTDESYLAYWQESWELPDLKDCDVIWEEMGVMCDARQWADMPIELRRWLQQHRHRGVEIFGNVQEFADIDIAVRRLTHSLLYLTKIIGSRDPSPTTPPVKFVWGLIMVQSLDPREYMEEKKMRMFSSWPSFSFINKKSVAYYDMFNDIKHGEFPPLQHRERHCGTCGYVKKIHV